MFLIYRVMLPPITSGVLYILALRNLEPPTQLDRFINLNLLITAIGFTGSISNPNLIYDAAHTHVYVRMYILIIVHLYVLHSNPRIV